MTTVVTANAEVQTNEEAQVYVHDLDLFVTVQLLEETPTVLPLGKFCSEDGCSYGWINGETPRLTKNGKTTTCIMDNVVPLVVPGLSSSSSSSSASTSRPKDQSKSSGESEASKDPMPTRRAKASGSRGAAHTEDEIDEKDPTQGIPDWLQPFTVNLEDLETHVLAHSCVRANSDSEGEAFPKRPKLRRMRRHQFHEQKSLVT